VTVDQIPDWLRLFFPWQLRYQKTSCTKQCEIEILAPKKIHTRSNPDPKAAILVSDPEKLVRKRKEKPVTPVLHPNRYLSLPKDGVTSLEDLEFDVKFEQALSKLSLNLV